MPLCLSIHSDSCGPKLLVTSTRQQSCEPTLRLAATRYFHGATSRWFANSDSRGASQRASLSSAIGETQNKGTEETGRRASPRARATAACGPWRDALWSRSSPVQTAPARASRRRHARRRRRPAPGRRRLRGVARQYRSNRLTGSPVVSPSREALASEPWYRNSTVAWSAGSAAPSKPTSNRAGNVVAIKGILRLGRNLNSGTSIFTDAGPAGKQPEQRSRTPVSHIPGVCSRWLR